MPAVLRVLLLAAVLLPFGFPAPAEAQRRSRTRVIIERDRCHACERRELAVQIGGFTYDLAGDGTFPMAAVRADWRLSRHILAEVGASYALAETDVLAGMVVEEENVSVLSATVGVQAEARLGRVRPYVGAAVGLFGLFEPEPGSRFFRPTHAFPVGARIRLTDELGLRGEVRYRLDQHQSGTTADNFEQTVGITVRF